MYTCDFCRILGGIGSFEYPTSEEWLTHLLSQEHRDLQKKNGAKNVFQHWDPKRTLMVSKIQGIKGRELLTYFTTFGDVQNFYYLSKGDGGAQFCKVLMEDVKEARKIHKLAQHTIMNITFLTRLLNTPPAQVPGSNGIAAVIRAPDAQKKTGQGQSTGGGGGASVSPSKAAPTPNSASPSVSTDTPSSQVQSGLRIGIGLHDKFKDLYDKAEGGFTPGVGYTCRICEQLVGKGEEQWIQHLISPDHQFVHKRNEHLRKTLWDLDKTIMVTGVKGLLAAYILRYVVAFGGLVIDFSYFANKDGGTDVCYILMSTKEAAHRLVKATLVTNHCIGPRRQAVCITLIEEDMKAKYRAYRDQILTNCGVLPIEVEDSDKYENVDQEVEKENEPVTNIDKNKDEQPASAKTDKVSKVPESEDDDDIIVIEVRKEPAQPQPSTNKDKTCNAKTDEGTKATPDASTANVPKSILKTESAIVSNNDAQKKTGNNVQSVVHSSSSPKKDCMPGNKGGLTNTTPSPSKKGRASAVDLFQTVDDESPDKTTPNKQNKQRPIPAISSLGRGGRGRDFGRKYVPTSRLQGPPPADYQRQPESFRFPRSPRGQSHVMRNPYPEDRRLFDQPGLPSQALRPELRPGYCRGPEGPCSPYTFPDANIRPLFSHQVHPHGGILLSNSPASGSVFSGGAGRLFSLAKYHQDMPGQLLSDPSQVYNQRDHVRPSNYPDQRDPRGYTSPTSTSYYTRGQAPSNFPRLSHSQLTAANNSEDFADRRMTDSQQRPMRYFSSASNEGNDKLQGGAFENNFTRPDRERLVPNPLFGSRESQSEERRPLFSLGRGIRSSIQGSGFDSRQAGPLSTHEPQYGGSRLLPTMRRGFVPGGYLSAGNADHDEDEDLNIEWEEDPRSAHSPPAPPVKKFKLGAPYPVPTKARSPLSSISRNPTGYSTVEERPGYMTAPRSDTSSPSYGYSDTLNSARNSFVQNPVAGLRVTSDDFEGFGINPCGGISQGYGGRRF